jgi:hypothetical protein
MTSANDELIQLIEAYFAKQSAFDGDGMLAYWHPGGTMYLVGNQNEFRVVTIEEQVGHMKEAKERVPDLQVEFVLDEIEQVAIQEDLIASAHVRYRMIFPAGYGQHRCFYHLAKIQGKWGIVNAVDRGFQVLAAEE